MKITFVLPSDDISGGVRVTVKLAEELLKKGYNVRIACRRHTVSIKNAIKHLLIFHNSWVDKYQGSKEYFNDLNDLNFHDGEIVIAVGSFTINYVASLQANVFKIRYCHGFNEHLQDLMQQVWSIKIPTIAVSEMLIPKLNEYGFKGYIPVVPNAICHDEYFLENTPKTGIGALYSSNPKKDPVTFINLFKRVKENYPDISLNVFGAEKKPKSLKNVKYFRYPSIKTARKLYNESLIWLVTSKSEGFCLPILEAMACGCVVISTDHDTAPGLINNGNNGVLVPVGDAEAFLKNIALVLKDDALRNKLRNNALTTAQNYLWAKSADLFIDAVTTLRNNI
jgi:glycosyltransferase involved in cell wall biosynthesis